MGDNLIGYARVSTGDQNPDLQHDALTAAGCTRVFSDTASGALDKRPQLDALLNYLRPGDVLVTCWWSGGWTGSAAPCVTSPRP